MCGGTILYIPCSRVGHLYKHRYTYRKDLKDAFLKGNLIRVAEVWMDEYAKYFYQVIGYDLVKIYENLKSRLGQII